MNQQTYYPSFKVIESLRSTSKKEYFRKSEEKRITQYNKNVSGSPKKRVDENNRNDSKSKEVTSNNIFVKIKKEVNDITHLHNNNNRNIALIEKGKNSNSPIRKGLQINNNMNKVCNYVEFKNNIIKNLNKSNNYFNGSPNIMVKRAANKSQGENSCNVSQNNKNKSSNVSFEKNQKEDKDKSTGGKTNSENNSLGNSSKSKSTNNLLKTNIEVNSPEELHYFYVQIYKQNKNLVYKFEGKNAPEVLEETDL